MMLFGWLAFALHAHAAVCPENYCVRDGVTVVDEITGEPWCDTDELPLYDTLTACEKQDYLGWNLANRPYAELPPAKSPGLLDALLKLRKKSYLEVTFSHAHDLMPEGREKLLHGSGSAGKVEWIADPQQPYTGLFKGAVGIARLSIAKSDEGKESFTPGIALKLLVDGQASRNIMAMVSLDGQGENQNFFANSFSNKIDPPKDKRLKLVAGWFKKVLANPFRLPLEHLAAIERDGSSVAVENARTPFEIVLEPNEDLAWAGDIQTDFRLMLKSIRSGDLLYTVWARDKESTGFLQKIGRIVARSSFVASQYGDERLFFQHFKP